jgi:GAF domain-containing protein
MRVPDSSLPRPFSLTPEGTFAHPVVDRCGPQRLTSKESPMPRRAKALKPAKAKVSAELAAARKLLKNEASRRRQAEKRLAEAMEQQTAAADILRVISSSPTDVQPVFAAIAASAARLTGATRASVYEFDGSVIHLRVVEPADWLHGDDFQRNFPRQPAPDFAAGRVILERAVLHRADLWNDPDTPELTREWARRMDLRSILWVPMLRDGVPIGVIELVVERDQVHAGGRPHRCPRGAAGPVGRGVRRRHRGRHRPGGPGGPGGGVRGVPAGGGCREEG